jgi:hypothetical protein
MSATVSQVFRIMWAAPATLLGLTLSALAVGGGRVRLVDGVVEAHGAWLAWCLRRLIPIPGGAAAITIGHVVLGRDAPALDRTRAHERIHVRQYERWGPLFIPAYFIASLGLLAMGRDPYLENPFEREAFRLDGQLDLRAS